MTGKKFGELRSDPGFVVKDRSFDLNFQVTCRIRFNFVDPFDQGRASIVTCDVSEFSATLDLFHHARPIGTLSGPRFKHVYCFLLFLRQRRQFLQYGSRRRWWWRSWGRRGWNGCSGRTLGQCRCTCALNRKNWVIFHSNANVKKSTQLSRVCYNRLHEKGMEKANSEGEFTCQKLMKRSGCEIKRYPG